MTKGHHSLTWSETMRGRCTCLVLSKGHIARGVRVITLCIHKLTSSDHLNSHHDAYIHVNSFCRYGLVYLLDSW